MKECVQNGVSVYFKCQKCGHGRDYFETDVQIAFSKHKTDFKCPSTFEQDRKKELDRIKRIQNPPLIEYTEKKFENSDHDQPPKGNQSDTFDDDKELTDVEIQEQKEIVKSEHLDDFLDAVLNDGIDNKKFEIIDE